MKFNAKDEKTKQWEIGVKNHAVLSSAIQLSTNEYPEKFFPAERINGSVNRDTITVTGDLAIWDTEVHSREIEYAKEKESYKIILKRK